MANFLKSYEVTLKVVGPVFIGSGEELQKRDYITLQDEQSIAVLDMSKLFMYIKKKGRITQNLFERFMSDGKSNDLTAWIQQNKLDLYDIIDKCLKYKLDYGQTTLEDDTTAAIKTFIKNAYGEPYIPGTSLKGMFRTILLGSSILNGNIRLNINDIDITNKKNLRRTKYLKKDIGKIEQNAFNNLNRPESKKGDAVNDLMAGFRVSDSIPISTNDLVLCQKIEYHLAADMTDGSKETRLNLIRECIKPGTEIKFTLTIDTSICKIKVEQLEEAIKTFNACYSECFVKPFIGTDKSSEMDMYIDILSDKQMVLGGGAGFVSKTVVYPIYGKKEGINKTKTIFENTNVAIDHNHQYDHKASPHILKCTHFEGKTVQFGICELNDIRPLN